MKLFPRKNKEKNKAKKRLSEVLHGQEPPAFRTGTLKLMRLLREPDSELHTISEALSWDPGLVLRVLRTVNSAAFGLSRPVDCMQHAVSLLGRTKLEQLVLGIAVKGNLPTGQAPGFDSRRFWVASFFRASLARTLAGALHPAEQARSFTGGLLQDMAVPLLAHARTTEYGPILEAWHEVPDAELHLLERSALGWSHDEIGYHLAVGWELPDSLTSVIGGHHGDETSSEDVPPALRLVAVHRETEQEHGIEAIIEGARDYGLEPDWILEVVRTSQEQAAELASTV